MPFVTSAPAARSQSGEKPKAAIEPISTTLPAPLRTISFVAFGSYSSTTLRRCLDAADDLDRDAQEVLRRRLVEARAADEARQHDLGGLVDAASDEREDRPHRALGERQKEGETAGHR